jgi:hypothetical protein
MAVNTITVDPVWSRPVLLYTDLVKKPELAPNCAVSRPSHEPQELNSGSEGCWGPLYLESGSLRHMRRHIPEERV